MNIICDSTGSEFGYIRLYNEISQELSLNVWTTNVLQYCETTHDEHFPLNCAGDWADSIRLKKPQFINRSSDGSSVGGLNLGEFKVFRHISLPIFEKEKIVGILGMGNSQLDYTNNDVATIEKNLTIGWPAAKTKIDKLNQENLDHTNSVVNDTPENLLLKFLQVILRAVEIRDEYTQRHQTNVSCLAEIVADELELEESFRFGLKVGSMIHDIGKITIPSQILNKTGALQPAEFTLLKMHAENGGAMFKDIDFPWPIGKMVEQHHERIDGSGYPGGLAGDQICQEARIIGIVDTFDAMASERPYRKSLGSAAAIELIKNDRGTKFDPYIVDAFLSCFNKDSSFGGLYAPE